MTDYNPANVGTVTRYVVVESYNVTPSDVAIRGYEVAKGVMVKENCFGLVIMGKEADVDRVVAEVRKMDPAHIFVKDRGFPPGDARRCRAIAWRCTARLPWDRVRDGNSPVYFPRP